MGLSITRTKIKHFHMFQMFCRCSWEFPFLLLLPLEFLLMPYKRCTHTWQRQYQNSIIDTPSNHLFINQTSKTQGAFILCNTLFTLAKHLPLCLGKCTLVVFPELAVLTTLSQMTICIFLSTSLDDPANRSHVTSRDGTPPRCCRMHNLSNSYNFGME